MQFQTLHQTVQYFAKMCKNLKYLKTLWTICKKLVRVQTKRVLPPSSPSYPRLLSVNCWIWKKRKKDQLLDLKNQMFKNKNVQKTGEGKNLLWRIGMCGWQRREAAKKIVSEHQIFEMSTVNLWFLWGEQKPGQIKLVFTKINGCVDDKNYCWISNICMN